MSDEDIPDQEMPDPAPVHHIDRLGRYLIPKSIRTRLGITANTPVEFFTDDGGQIVLKVYRSGCVFCGEVEDRMEAFQGNLVFEKCRGELAARG